MNVNHLEDDDFNVNNTNYYQGDHNLEHSLAQTELDVGKQKSVDQRVKELDGKLDVINKYKETVIEKKKGEYKQKYDNRNGSRNEEMLIDLDYDDKPAKQQDYMKSYSPAKNTVDLFSPSMLYGLKENLNLKEGHTGFITPVSTSTSSSYPIRDSSEGINILVPNLMDLTIEETMTAFPRDTIKDAQLLDIKDKMNSDHVYNRVHDNINTSYYSEPIKVSNAQSELNNIFNSGESNKSSFFNALDTHNFNNKIEVNNQPNLFQNDNTNPNPYFSPEIKPINNSPGNSYLEYSPKSIPTCSNCGSPVKELSPEILPDYNQCNYNKKEIASEFNPKYIDNENIEFKSSEVPYNKQDQPINYNNVASHVISPVRLEFKEVKYNDKYEYNKRHSYDFPLNNNNPFTKGGESKDLKYPDVAQYNFSQTNLSIQPLPENKVRNRRHFRDNSFDNSLYKVNNKALFNDQQDKFKQNNYANFQSTKDVFNEGFDYIPVEKYLPFDGTRNPANAHLNYSKNNRINFDEELQKHEANVLSLVDSIKKADENFALINNGLYNNNDIQKEINFKNIDPYGNSNYNIQRKDNNLSKWNDANFTKGNKQILPQRYTDIKYNGFRNDINKSDFNFNLDYNYDYNRIKKSDSPPGFQLNPNNIYNEYDIKLPVESASTVSPMKPVLLSPESLLMNKLEEGFDPHPQLGVIQEDKVLSNFNQPKKMTSNDLERMLLMMNKKDLVQLNYNDLTIGKLLGSGGYKDVYKGYYKGEEVAICELKLTEFNRADLEEIKNEILVMAQVNNDSIVKFIGIAKGPEKLCIVTELCHNGDLYDYIKKNGKPGFQEQLDFMQSITFGVHYLHNRRTRIIHRDLKSMNILITKDKQAKITDFGLARIRQHMFSPAHTQCGTPNWQAPEVWSSNPSYDEKVDIYSLGLIFWEILQWGIEPFPFYKYQNEELVKNVVEFKKRPSMENLVGYPKSLLDLIEKMWHHDPNERPNISEVEVFLNKLRQ